MITIQNIMKRLNCSEQHAKMFFIYCDNDQEAIRKEVARQAHKRETTPAITKYKPLKEVAI